MVLLLNGATSPIPTAQKLRFNAELATKAESAAYCKITLAHSETGAKWEFCFIWIVADDFWFINLRLFFAICTVVRFPQQNPQFKLPMTICVQYLSFYLIHIRKIIFNPKGILETLLGCRTEERIDKKSHLFSCPTVPIERQGSDWLQYSG